MEDDNGILAQIPGGYIANAKLSLPPAATAEDRVYDVEIDAPNIGRVRISIRRQKHKRGKMSHWFWVAIRADRV